MVIYFVRHGQTTSNLKNVVVTPQDELTQKGISQAQTIAEKIAKFPIAVIVSSSQKRALKTAQIIGKKINKEVVSTSLLRERK